MSLVEMLKSRLPMNRKEVFFTATVLPGIVCCNDFKHFGDFLSVLGLDGFIADVCPETANVQFFTEYSITEAAVTKPTKARFATLPFASKERPDVLILIDDPVNTLIAIEGKMFSAVRPKDIGAQMTKQRQTLDPMAHDLNVELRHFALLPQELIATWRNVCPDELSALCASPCVKLVTWEAILKPFKDLRLATYWVAILDTALRDFSDLVSTIKFGEHCDGIFPGAEIVERFQSDPLFRPASGSLDRYIMMGRTGGLDGAKLKQDIENGSWKTHKYEVKSSPDSILHWFPISDFIHKIALQSAKS